MRTTAIQIIKKLNSHGYTAFFAGGCVRDLLLGIRPKDFDIVTSAKPEEILSLFSKVIPVGLAYGVVTIVENNHSFEIATFRSDSGYSDGRRPNAVIFSNPAQDALRRDFSINGLFYDPINDKIIDFVEGQKDLEARIVRFIGNPTSRIREDHLRILRAVRFKNQLKFQYDPETYKALKKHSSLVIDKVAPERLADELKKMITISEPAKVFEDLSHLNILNKIIPELELLRGVAQPFEFHREGDVWDHTMKSINSLSKTASLRLRFATLFHDIGKPQTYKLTDRIRYDSHCQVSAKIATQILTRLRFPNKFIQEVNWLISHHMMMLPLTTMSLGRRLHWFHHPLFNELLQLFQADISGTTPSDFSLFNKIKQLYKSDLKSQPTLPSTLLTGADLIKFFNLKPGPKIGELLSKLREKQLDKEINNKSEALTWVRSNID